jgi:iron-sulfur cluster assembly protein
MLEITLTEAAIKEVKRIALEQDMAPENTFLRVGVKGGGCSGFSWLLHLDDKFDEKFDVQEEVGGIKVISDKRSAIYIPGTMIDFKDEGLMKRGFICTNINTKATCGCGSSFSM